MVAEGICILYINVYDYNQIYNHIYTALIVYIHNETRATTTSHKFFSNKNVLKKIKLFSKIQKSDLLPAKLLIKRSLTFWMWGLVEDVIICFKNSPGVKVVEEVSGVSTIF